MVVYRGLDDPRLRLRPAAVAVGNFDGLHLGHRKILSRLCRLAGRGDLRSLVLTFEPHPERALGRRSVRMIDTPGQRLARLRETCVDAVLMRVVDGAIVGEEALVNPPHERGGCSTIVTMLANAGVGTAIVVGMGVTVVGTGVKV